MPDGVEIAAYRWDVSNGDARAIVQIAHGMSEYGQRYGRLAGELRDSGYIVYASDHRGHGDTARTPDDLGYFRDEDGWGALVDDVHCVNRMIAERHPGLPRVLLGHSMGAMVAQDYLVRYGGTVDAAVLSATGGKRRFSHALPG